MKLRRRQFLSLATGAAALSALPGVATARDYPTRPVRLILSFPAGGPNDVVGRLLGQWLSERLGQPFIIENRSGTAELLALKLWFARRPTVIRSCKSIHRTRSTPRFTTISTTISSATSFQSRALFVLLSSWK